MEEDAVGKATLKIKNYTAGMNYCYEYAYTYVANVKFNG